MRDYISFFPAIFIFIIVLLLDYYVFQIVKSSTQGLNQNTRKIIFIIFWSFNIAAYILFLGMLFSDYHNWPGFIRRYFFGIAICWIVGKIFTIPFLLLDDFLRLGKWVVSLAYAGNEKQITGHNIGRWKFLTQVGAIGGLFVFGNFIWGILRTAHHYVIRDNAIPIKNLSTALEGITIVQISDFHLGSFPDSDPVKTIVEKINNLNPDIVFFTGDLVNDLSTEAEPYIPILSQIKAKYGIFSTLGNHDYGDYYHFENKEDKIKNLNRLKEIHAEIGWNLLNNRNEILKIKDATLAIIGVENWGHREYFPKYGDLDLASKGTENAEVKLLLSHDPSHWNYVVSKQPKEINCTFSGHTHGFQFGIEIPALKIKWSPSKYIYEQWAGFYSRGNKHLYVNRGIGYLGFPGRVGIPPEITLHTLVKA